MFVKEQMKKADILACVVDDKNKRIHSFIMDVKSNISAFSDDLYKNDALITVIKEIRDFINQLADEKVSKDGIFYLYKSEGYNEEETFGIVTKSFEKNKFLDASEMIENILNLRILYLFREDKWEMKDYYEHPKKRNLPIRHHQGCFFKHTMGAAWWENNIIDWCDGNDCICDD